VVQTCHLSIRSTLLPLYPVRTILSPAAGEGAGVGSGRPRQRAPAWFAAGGACVCVASFGEAADVSAAPHFPQNLAPERVGAPQDEQRIGAGAPHASQNLLPSGMSALQLGHSIAAPRYPANARVTYDGGMRCRVASPNWRPERQRRRTSSSAVSPAWRRSSGECRALRRRFRGAGRLSAENFSVSDISNSRRTRSSELRPSRFPLPDPGSAVSSKTHGPEADPVWVTGSPALGARLGRDPL
jgi:hypothetical protein